MAKKRNSKMNKTEKKRQKEQYVVEEMIRLYCRKTIRKKKDRKDRCVLTVKDFRIMQNKEARSVRLWKKKRSVRTVRYIVISRR